MAIIRFKRAVAADWALDDPILQEGEPGFEIDTGKLKVGDGASHWSELDYVGTGL
jgi:hypothetical protein